MRTHAASRQTQVSGRGHRGELVAWPAVLATALAGCAATPPAGPVAPVPEAVAAAAPPAPELLVGVQLVGMDSRAVEGLLGQPSLQRRERPAQYWRYSYAGCVLDLFLYAEVGEPLRVAYYEVRPDPWDTRPPSARCESFRARLGPVEGAGGDLPPVQSH